MKRTRTNSGGWNQAAYLLTHDEWSRIGNVFDLAAFMASVAGLFLPVATVIAILGTPYFLWMKYKERKWGSRGLIFVWRLHPGRGSDNLDFYTANPDDWDEYCGPEWTAD